jgi:hypothetical protein
MSTETTSLAPGHLSPAETGEAVRLDTLVDQYCAIRYGATNVEDGRANMEQNFLLLEPLHGADENSQPVEKPAMTICIPDAVLSESDETIERVVRASKRAQEAFGRPVEIVLWSNGADDTEGTPNLTANYQQRRERLARLTSEGLQIKTALQPNPQGSKSISEIRADYMEAATIDALHAGQSSDYPILWLDADTTYLSSNAITDIADALEKNLAPFVHATEHFTTEWAAGQPLNERDVATRAIMIDELHRRKFAKLVATEGKRVNYTEESGIAFRLGTYLEIGGVNTDNPVDEVSNMIGYAKGLVHEGKLDRDRPFEETNQLYHSNEGVVAYLPRVKIGLSARHIYRAVQEKGLYGISHPQESGAYILHSGGGQKGFENAGSPYARPEAPSVANSPFTKFGLSARSIYRAVKEKGRHGSSRPQPRSEQQARPEAPQIDAAATRYFIKNNMTTRRKLAARTRSDLGERDKAIIDRVIDRAFVK